MRIDGPARHWKVCDGVHVERPFSNVYVEAAPSKCSTEQALRFIIPARFTAATEGAAWAAAELCCSRRTWPRIGADSVKKDDRV